MKPTRPGSRRQKIILYYALAILLPGIILGYMASRGIRNDQALREKESLRKLEIISQAFFSEIDSSFVKFYVEQTSDSALSGFTRGDPSILVLFSTDANGSKIINHTLLYLPEEFMIDVSGQSGQPDNLKEGQHLEFIEQRFSDALRFNQDIVLKTTDSTEKIQALVASARLYNKMNQPEKAKAIYAAIRKDYPGSLLNGQIPLGLMASLEILKINLAMEEMDEFRFNSQQCLELLLHPSCEYDGNQFDMFSQAFKEIISETDPVIDSLFAEIDARKARTDYLIGLILKPDQTATVSNDYFKTGRNRISVIPFNSKELSAVFLSGGNRNSNQVGMIIDFPIYLRLISEELIRKLDPGSSINFKIEDNNRELAFTRAIGEGTSYISFPFPENLPKFELLLSENRPGFMAALFKAGSGIYLLIFILIALFMLLGFAFTIYTLNVELRLSKLKSEFISNVSHELKSPLTAIRMMTEMLHHNRVQTEERKSSYYSAMLEESERLSHLIDNILDFSRIDEDRKKYEFVDVDLDELFRKFLESLREILPEPAFEIRYSCPEKVPLIRVDRDAILQVFYNLVDNAIKFSGTSKQIDISLIPGENEVVFCVKDYGIGIPAKDLEKIFERFFRGEKSQKLGIRGSGIGLTIVKRIVEDHNGHINLESKPGEGSKFCVYLPIHGTKVGSGQ